MIGYGKHLFSNVDENSLFRGRYSLNFLSICVLYCKSVHEEK